MMGTYFAGLTQSVFLATWVVASVGFCFAIANWLPFALLGILIQTQQVQEIPESTNSANGAAGRHASGGGREADEVTAFTVMMVTAGQ